jgi:phosphatidylcholine synthase
MLPGLIADCYRLPIGTVFAAHGLGIDLLKPSRRKRPQPLHVMAYGVHVFTALGAALGFLALDAVINGDLVRAFWWLGAALVVDAVDGPLARRLNVVETASRYDGALLDLVVDFITYVFVPVAMLLRPEVVAQPYGFWAGLIIVLGSALYFADTGMKTEDLWFKGFPAVWNIVVFNIVVFGTPAWLTMVIALSLTAMQFLPVVFVHPVRVRRWRAFTLGMLGLWTGAAFVALLQDLRPDVWIKGVLLAGTVYFLGLGLLRQDPGTHDAGAKDSRGSGPAA